MNTYGLTRREYQVIELTAMNYSAKMIASELGISEGTVTPTKKKAYVKLKINTAIEATWWYMNKVYGVVIPSKVKIFQKAIVFCLLLTIGYMETHNQAHFERSFRTRKTSQSSRLRRRNEYNYFIEL